MNALTKSFLLAAFFLFTSLYSMEQPAQKFSDKGLESSLKALQTCVDNLYTVTEEKKQEDTLSLSASSLAQRHDSLYNLYDNIIKHLHKMHERYSEAEKLTIAQHISTIEQKLDSIADMIDPYLSRSPYASITDQEREALRQLQENVPMDTFRIAIENMYQFIQEKINEHTLASHVPTLAKAIQGLLALYQGITTSLRNALDRKQISQNTYALLIQKISPAYEKLQAIIELIPSHVESLEQLQDSSIPQEVANFIKTTYPELEEYKAKVKDLYTRTQESIKQKMLPSHLLDFYQELKSYYALYMTMRQLLADEQENIDKAIADALTKELQVTHDMLDDIAEMLQADHA
jgi:hypothetical protein